MSPPANRRGVIGAGVVLALGAALSLGLAGVVAMQTAGGAFVPRVESFWPTSLVTWLAIVVSGITCARYWRDRQKDSSDERTKALAKAMEPVLEKVGTIETHFDGEVRRMEQLVERTATAMRGGITTDINGWSRRIEVVERAQEAQDAFNESVVRFMGQSETDRRNLGDRLEALTTTVDRMGEKLDKKMDNVLTALVQLKGGRNQ